jgi:hypothetical protein
MLLTRLLTSMVRVWHILLTDMSRLWATLHVCVQHPPIDPYLSKPSVEHPFGANQPFAVAAIPQTDLWSSSRAPPVASIPPQRATATAAGTAVLQPSSWTDNPVRMVTHASIAAGLQIDPQEHLSSTHGLTEDDVKVFKAPSRQLGLGVTSVQDTTELDDAPKFPLG